MTKHVSYIMYLYDKEVSKRMCGINNRKRDIIGLTIIYFLSQWLLLVVSGRWWDDWCLWLAPAEAINSLGIELGRPSVSVILTVARALPESGYRWITYFMMYCCMLCLYSTLKTCLKLRDDDCFWIAAIYAIVPINDGRVALAMFPYTVGLFFFMLGLAFLSYVLNKDRLNTFIRIILLGLFLLSFTLNSNLVFYIIVLLMLLKHTKSIRDLKNFTDFFTRFVV